MNKEEFLEKLDFNNQLFPKFTLRVKDANNDVFEIYKVAERIKVYKLGFRNQMDRPKESVLKHIIFPVESYEPK